VLVVEFTIEPFVEGQPGPHVTSAVAAVEQFGLEVEFGPFGSSFRAPADRIGEVTAAMLQAAFAHGATYVTFQAERAGDEPADTTDVGTGGAVA
jgi:uncharacterized protein YqgV (UPF0045/DUF77 family)